MREIIFLKKIIFFEKFLSVTNGWAVLVDILWQTNRHTNRHHEWPSYIAALGAAKKIFLKFFDFDYSDVKWALVFTFFFQIFWFQFSRYVHVHACMARVWDLEKNQFWFLFFDFDFSILILINCIRLWDEYLCKLLFLWNRYLLMLGAAFLLLAVDF